jgi:mannitol/fructose-specific phosphotransferase system IIA component (Ntr-type)
LRKEALERLREREEQGGTFVGEDTSFPHARISGIDEPIVAMAVSPEGIHDPEVNGSARIMFVLISPESPPSAHVTYLGEISRMAQDDQWRRQVLDADTADQIRKVVRKWAKQAERGSHA